MSTRVLRSRNRKRSLSHQEDDDEPKIVPTKENRQKRVKAKNANAKKAKISDTTEDAVSATTNKVNGKKAKVGSKAQTGKKSAAKSTSAPAKKAKVAPKTSKKASAQKADSPLAVKKDDSVTVMKKIEFKDKVPVDEECVECKNDYKVFINGDEVFNAMLNQTNIGGNNNKYYLLQLLKHKDKSDFKVWFRWGRVGKIAGTKLEHVNSFDTARNVFEKKFKDKTKNDWCFRDDFEHFPGKYELIQMDYGEQSCSDKIEQPKIEVPESKLALQVQNLIKLIFDIKEFNATVKEMKFDPRKSPLGKLTTKQLESGYEILSTIEDIVKKRTKGNLVEACNKFYTRIPHDFGMKCPTVIRTVEEIKEKVDLLEALGDIKIAMKMIEDSIGLGNPLDSQYSSLDCSLSPLARNSSDFMMIQKYVSNTHGATHNRYKIQVINIFAVDNQKATFKKDLGNRRLLWHGSRLSNWCGILKQGLRIAPPEAPVTGYMFGKGVYFADMVSKSANYCYSSSRQPAGLLLLCEVALGQCQEKKNADYRADILAAGTSSTKGVGKTQPDPKQNHYTNDGVLVPLGTPTTTPNSHDSSLLYNEYVVYNTDQVQPRYLVQLDFKFNSLW